MLGFAMAFISSRNISSTALSPMPKMRSAWLTISPSEKRRR